MPENKRATIYLDAELHQALRLKAAVADRTISELVNDAVRESLTEDADDLTAIADRVAEPTRPFEEYVAGLRRKGAL